MPLLLFLKYKRQLVKGYKVTLSCFLMFCLLVYLLLILSYLVVQNSNLLCLCKEERFIAALSSDAAIVRGLQKDLREARKKIKLWSVSPRNAPTSKYYATNVFPTLVKSKAIGIIINEGWCVQVFLQVALFFGFLVHSRFTELLHAFL
jgi:hypothetical protein